MATINSSNQSSAGLQVLSTAGATSAVTITGTANQVTVTNGDGTGGNPTLALPQSIATSSNVQFATLNTTSGSATQLVQAYTGTASNAGPIQDLYHNSTSASGNPLGEIDFNGKSSAGTKRLYASIATSIISNTDASEKGGMTISTMSAGTSTTQINLLDTGGQYRGNNTNTAAPAGYIGQILSTNVASGSAVTLTNATTAQVTSVSLTAGNWMLVGEVVFTGATTATLVAGSVNATSATLTAFGVDAFQNQITSTTSGDATFACPVQFVSLSATTTYYLNAYCAFTVGTAKAYGKIQAVRIG